MKRGLFIIITAILVILSLTACFNSNKGGEEFFINVPEEPILAELGSYDLPKFVVVDKDNLIKAGYQVIVKKVVDPNGKEVKIAYNKINATVTGVYTIVYTEVNGKVADAELKVNFADRTAPVLDIKDEALPQYYIQGMRYTLPVYSLSGDPALEKCYIKVYYLAETGGEKTEVTVTDGAFTVEYNKGFYQILIHAEDATGNAKDYTFNIEATGPSEIVEGKIIYSDEPFGVSQLSLLWSVWSIEYSTEKAWENEAGSIKVTASSGGTDYLILSKLIQKNVKAYDSLVMRVYNANDYEVYTGCAWFGDTVLAPNAWTEVVLSLSDLNTLGSHPSVQGLKPTSANLENLSIRFWNDYKSNTLTAGSELYVSAMYADNRGTSGPSEVKDDVIAYYDEMWGASQGSFFWPDCNKQQYVTDVKYGNEAGSLKITCLKDKQDWNYYILNNPSITDVSKYDFIEFYVYNPTANDFLIQLLWCGDTTCKAGEWTLVRFPVSLIKEGVTDVNNVKIPATDITNLSLCIWTKNMTKGDCIYFSQMKGGYSTDVEPEPNPEPLPEELNYLPKYDGNYSIVDCGDGTYMMHISGTDATAFESYCNTVLANGFEKKSQRSEANNAFATFTSESKYIYVYFTAYNSEIRVMTGPVESLLPEDCSTEASKTVTPYIASIPQPAQGEGYIVRLPDGRFIIQDGGYEGDDRVYNTIRELVGDEEIVIAAWFISHPHADHYPAFIDFIKEHADDSDVTIEKVVYNYGHIDMLTSDVTEGDPVPTEDFLALSQALATYTPGVPVFRAHTGQIIDFGCATVEILYTIEDHIPTTITNPNDSSMVIRIEIGEDSVIFLNDTCYASGPILHNLWGEWLKTDIVQIAHHGMWPSVESIYHDIQAEVVIVPNLCKYFKNYIADSRWVTVIDAALSYAKDLYVSGDKIVVHELPYVVQNNKGEMYDYIINYTGRDDYKGFDGYDMQEGDIAPFDKFVDGYTSIGTSYGTAEYTTEQKFGDEAGSLKLTVAKDSEVYLTINFPYTTDLSEYDYIVFNVYNPTDADIKAGICWAGDTVCKAGQWTEIRVPVSNFGLSKIHNLAGKVLPINNICGIALRLISGFEVNDVFYISAVRAEKNPEKEPVTEDVVTKFDSTEDLSTINVYWGTAHTVSIDNTVKHGDDKGSLKVVAASTSFNYVIINNPYNTDFSAYDYISFWVYNPGSTDFSMGTTWAADTVCKAGEWTEVKITKAMFESGKVVDMNSNVLSMSNITKLPLRLISNLAVGDIFYISSVRGGMDTE